MIVMLSRSLSVSDSEKTRMTSGVGVGSVRFVVEDAADSSKVGTSDEGTDPEGVPRAPEQEERNSDTTRIDTKNRNLLM